MPDIFKSTISDYLSVALKEADERMKARSEYRASIDVDATFCPEDLGDWIALCEAANVPYIPATVVAEVDTDDVVKYDTEGPHTERTRAFWTAVDAARQTPDHMMRWSNCSCAEIKYRLSKGETQWDQEILDSFMVEDIRAFDMICRFPKQRIKAWLRPWMTLDIVDRFPLEFRVFVECNKIVGVSSYYPQRPLPLTFDIISRAMIVTSLTECLIRKQTKPLNMPNFLAPDMPATENHWTADFAFIKGEAMFLEGGPPHLVRGGAHPCCFAVGEIEGIALRPRVGMAGDVAEVLSEEMPSRDEIVP